MQKEIDEVCDEITEALEANKLVLPTLPEVAIEVRNVAEDNASDCKHLTKIIYGDPSVSAHMLRLANSPLMRRSDQVVTDLRLAIMQMGFGTSANLAIGISITQMFTANSQIVADRMRSAVRLSKDVAGLCQLVCKFSTQLQPEMAMLAGLVHNIGVLPVLKYAEAKPALLKRPPFLDLAIMNLHPKLGDRILQRWEFAPELCSVPSQHLEFSREVSEVDYADIVTFALLECSKGSDSPYASIDSERVSALRRLEIGEGSASEAFHTEDMQEKVRAAVGTFG